MESIMVYCHLEAIKISSNFRVTAVNKFKHFYWMFINVVKLFSLHKCLEDQDQLLLCRKKVLEGSLSIQINFKNGEAILVLNNYILKICHNSTIYLKIDLCFWLQTINNHSNTLEWQINILIYTALYMTQTIVKIQLRIRAHVRKLTACIKLILTLNKRILDSILPKFVIIYAIFAIIWRTLLRNWLECTLTSSPTCIYKVVFKYLLIRFKIYTVTIIQ